MRRRLAGFLLVAGFAVPALASSAATPFEGFVTKVFSASEFDVGGRHVFCDTRTRWKRSESLPAYLSVLRVGTLVWVKGDIRNGKFVAKTVEVPSQNTKTEEKMSGRGLIQQIALPSDAGQSAAPKPAQGKIQAQVPGWTGTLWVEGYPLQLTTGTRLLDPSGAEFPAAHLTTNLWADYEADRGPDGSIVVSRITFEPNHIDPHEKELREKSEPEHIAADPGKHKPAQLKFGSHLPVTWELIPDQEVQDYVSAVGKSLVPQYQKDLPSSDPTKIDFRFYFVKVSSAWVGNMEDTVDLPNGIILVPGDVIVALDNEAQFAAWLSRSIARVVEKQDYLHRNRLQGQKYARLFGSAAGVMAEALVASPLGYGIAGLSSADTLAVELNKRSDRIGLMYMLQHGYDIREAAFTPWNANDPHVTNPLQVDTTPPLNTTKLMQAIQADYSGTEFDSLVTNREAFASIRSKVAALRR